MLDKTITRKSLVILIILNIHPLIFILSSIIDLFLSLRQLILYLRYCLLNLFIQNLSIVALVLCPLIVLLKIFFTSGPLRQFERTVCQHIDCLHLVTGILVQFLEYKPRTSELLHLHQIFTQSCQCFGLILLSFLFYPLVKL